MDDAAVAAHADDTDAVIVEMESAQPHPEPVGRDIGSVIAELTDAVDALCDVDPDDMTVGEMARALKLLDGPTGLIAFVQDARKQMADRLAAAMPPGPKAQSLAVEGVGTVRRDPVYGWKGWDSQALLGEVRRQIMVRVESRAMNSRVEQVAASDGARLALDVVAAVYPLAAPRLGREDGTQPGIRALGIDPHEYAVKVEGEYRVKVV